MPYASLEDALVFGAELERAFRCEAHDDHNASASVNAVTGLYFCMACGHGGRVDPDKIEISEEGLARHIKKSFAQIDAEHRYSESWLNAFDSFTPGPYWLSRFDEATCRFFRLGTAPLVATYPMRDNAGRVMGVVTRDLTGQRPQKYMYPSGVSNSRFLIDYHRVETPEIVLVEGMADVAAVYETGHHVALGCYRAWLSNAQVKLIHKYEPTRILVAYDQDAAGEKGYQRVKAALGRDFPVERLWWSSYNDVADIPLAQRRAMLTQTLHHDPVTALARA